MKFCIEVSSSHILNNNLYQNIEAESIEDAIHKVKIKHTKLFEEEQKGGSISKDNKLEFKSFKLTVEIPA